jgi:hypothetical protein
LIVFAKQKHFPHIRSLQDKTVGCGLMGVAGNKGAAVIRLQLYDTTFCFISAHLSAHRKNVGDRNADFHRIVESTHFRESATAPEQEYHEYVAGSGPSRNRSHPTTPPRQTSRERFQSGSLGLNGRRDLSAAQTNAAVGAGGGQVSRLLAPQHGSPGRTGGQANPTGVLVGVKGRKAKKDHGGKGKKTVGILDHDFVFWVGDLNYRMMDDINIEEVYRRIDAREVKMLRSFDQLTTVRAMGQAFSQFTEAPIDFLPTFKFLVGSPGDDYDRRPDGKNRCPAWCDRVLIYSHNKSLIKQTLYRSTGQTMSDHNPVGAQFEIK